MLRITDRLLHNQDKETRDRAHGQFPYAWKNNQKRLLHNEDQTCQAVEDTLYL